ncbi:putative sodium-coupled neutral amino acid transporter 10 [Vespa velutina]|uniref:putative sodium-coupled neutral amino acid transporter 10 n=1 Tax=Vespa velutina TaxID=202808 RepID=UPI001FB526C8|nr:putative sodium-coupled neutral amino acid transporter 10 [Vespa velutina]XP_047364554.1 putative sodium-coupled neutral amino acid transporter 10 [Vespa velutina]
MMAHLSHVMTLANSIIGVSVLAMPFCFKQCGIILAALVLLLSNLLSRLACHFLIKSAVMSRRRNFELLAFHAFGHMGKFLVELFIIGFLVGTCIAFFVVVGDLGPQIVGKIIDKRPEDIRTSLLIITSIFIILPLGLLRNIDSLSSICTATIVFYVCLILKVIAESTQHIFARDWTSSVYYWRPGGILQCLPIFSMALFCQTQLFEIYETIPNVSLEKMNEVVRGALNICTLVYLCVGFFGYIAFCTQSFTGNILMSFEPSLSSEMIKMGFFFSVAFSFPLVIFPCRASLNSLLFRRVYTHEPSMNYMPEARFRCLTIAIVFFSSITGILMPNIEFVLGLVGSTIGVMICLMFPAAFFISISSKHTNERLLAQVIIFVGIWIMILGTYANLYAMEESSNTRVLITTAKPLSQIDNLPLNLNKENIHMIPDVSNNPEILSNVKEKIDGLPEIKIMDENKHLDDIRQEPPVPVERIIVTEKPVIEKQNSVENIAASFAPEIKKIVEKIKTMKDDLNKEPNSVINNNKMIEHMDSVTLKASENIKVIKSKEETNEMSKNDNLINSDAIKKENSEIASEGEIANMVTVERHEKLRKTLEKHALERLQMLQEQKKLLKDIKEQKREFEREKERIGKNIEESIQNGSKDNNNNEVNIKQKSNMKEVENINKQSIINKSLIKNETQNKYVTETNIDKSVLKTSNIRNINIEIAHEKNDSKKFVDTKDNNNIQNVQKMKLKEDKHIDETHSISNYQEKINVTFDNISDKSKGTILSALTKGILIKSTSKDTLLKKKDIRTSQGKQESIINEINKSDETVIRNQNTVPIILQLKNQTNVNKSEQLTNKSDNDVQVMRRDILENHNREKREVTNINVLKTEVSPDVSTEEIKSFMKDVSMDIDRKKCSKTLENSQIEIANMQGKELKQKLPEMASIPTAPTLIKTNVHLSEKEQELTNSILVDPSITIKGKYIKLKQRDLKALNTDYTRNL